MNTKIIQFWLLLMLVFNSCASKKDKTYDYFDFIAFSKAIVKNDSLQMLLKDFPSGNYYFVLKSCNACTDLELAEIEEFNTLKNSIVVVSSDEELIYRINGFLKYTTVLEIDRGFSDKNIMMLKNENAMSLISLDEFLDKEK